jgi:hypothetical protein
MIRRASAARTFFTQGKRVVNDFMNEKKADSTDTNEGCEAQFWTAPLLLDSKISIPEGTSIAPAGIKSGVRTRRRLLPLNVHR